MSSSVRLLLDSLAAIAGVLVMLVVAGPPAGADQRAVLGAGPDDLKSGQVIVFAGTGEEGYSGDGWAARDARIGRLVGLAVGPDGTVYLADRNGRRVRAVSADGKINTVPGTVARRSPDSDVDYHNGWIYSPSNSPRATAVGADGTLYVAGKENIGRWNPDGTMTVLAGGGEQKFDEGGTGGDGGRATEANLREPADLAVDAAGNLYVADLYDNRIRKVDTNGTITTIAGGGTLTPKQAENAPATQLNLDHPSSVAVDSAGNVYFTRETYADKGNGFIGRVAPDGTFTIVVGNQPEGFSGDGGPASQARIRPVHGGIAMDGKDNLYFNDPGNGKIRMITPAGIITTVGSAARDSRDIAVGPDGDIYTVGQATVHRLVRHGEPAEDKPQLVRHESRWADQAPGTVIPVLGTGREPVEEDDSARILAKPLPPGPSQVAAGPDGTVYYADPARHQIGKVAADGTITVLAGTGKPGSTGDGGPAKAAALSSPNGVAVGKDGSLYIADTNNDVVRMVAPSGIITTVAGTGFNAPGGGTGPAREVALPAPRGVSVDPAGNLFITSHREFVHRIDPTGTSSPIAGGGDLWADKADGKPALKASLFEPDSVAADGAGTVYFVDTNRAAVRAVAADGVLRTVAGDSYRDGDEGGFAGDSGPATRSEVNRPRGLAAGPDGSLYLADTYNNRIRRVTPNGVITTFAGTGEPAEKGDGGPAGQAALLDPTGISVDQAGNLYVASPTGGSIRRIDPAGTITTVARFTEQDNDGRPATETAFGHVRGIAVDRAGTSYVGSIAGEVYAVGQDGRLDKVDGMTGSIDLATGPDGSIYASMVGSVTRRYPDGAVVPIAGGGPVEGPFEPGQLANTANLSVSDLAVGLDGAVYLAERAGGVYQVDRDGTLKSIVEHKAQSIAVGQDGSLYLAEYEGNRVLKVSDGKLAPFAGTGEDYRPDGEVGDGEPATEAVLQNPGDVAVAPNGTVYISSSDGIRRVGTDGTIHTILPLAQDPDEPGTKHLPGALALDAHGNLYFTEPGLHRARVIVRPGELTFPSFGWRTMWFGVNIALVVGVGAFVIVRYRKRLIELLTAGRSEKLSATLTATR